MRRRRKMRVTARPSKAAGIFSSVIGGIFVLIGLFVVIPTFGMFGILWTAIAASICGFNMYASFGKNAPGDDTYNEYMGSYIDIEEGKEYGVEDIPTEEIHSDAKERLLELQKLLVEGFITQEEYEEKRKEIIDDI